MITKFKQIKKLAVFKEFNWNSEVKHKGNSIATFKKINLIYGRNYSGKTTLSRIVRAMEMGTISDKYENPECQICFKNDPDISHIDYTNHSKTIRVFNEDFVKDNLSFITNPDESVQPFAIFGADNNNLEDEIKILNDKLGNSEEGKETSLYKDLKSLEKLYNISQKAYNDASRSLENQLSSKATGRPNGIKYQSSKFGDQNYNITKLKSEIETVKDDEYQPLSNTQKSQLENTLTETAKSSIPELIDLNLNFQDLSNKTKNLVEREIGKSNKIETLIKDAVLNRWVQEGKELHQGILNTWTCYIRLDYRLSYYLA